MRSEYLDHFWSYDFVHHRTDRRKAFSTLDILDEHSRECLATRSSNSLTRWMSGMCWQTCSLACGISAFIRSGNGPEFLAETVRTWMKAVGAKTAYIEPESSQENGYCESFDARFKDELLNGEVFYTLQELQIIIGIWRKHYNTKKPHSALGYRQPALETIVSMVTVPVTH